MIGQRRDDPAGQQQQWYTCFYWFSPHSLLTSSQHQFVDAMWLLHDAGHSFTSGWRQGQRAGGSTNTNRTASPKLDFQGTLVQDIFALDFTICYALTRAMNCTQLWKHPWRMHGAGKSTRTTRHKVLWSETSGQVVLLFGCVEMV